MAPQAMPKRAWLRQANGAPRPREVGRRLSLGIRQSDRMISPVCEARRDIFLRMLLVSNPGVLRSTKKPRTVFGSSSSSLAQTTATLQIGAFVIHILVLLRIYALLFWWVMVRM